MTLNEQWLKREPLRTKYRPFSPDEDNKLKRLVFKYGTNNWSVIAKEMPNRRPQKCRERWEKYLSSSIKKPWTKEEKELLIQLCESTEDFEIIRNHFPHRSTNDIKNECKRRKSLLSPVERGDISTLMEVIPF